MDDFSFSYCHSFCLSEEIRFLVCLTFAEIDWYHNNFALILKVAIA